MTRKNGDNPSNVLQLSQLSKGLISSNENVLHLPRDNSRALFNTLLAIDEIDSLDRGSTPEGREQEFEHLLILYSVRIKKNRIDFQEDCENREWALHVYDRSELEWCQVNALSDSEEHAMILKIEYVPDFSID
jgi:hypothetical protein